ncbi:hypothetical protein DY000_02046396 [Brassica cretica]|uniref:Uncharacterized protein n=1 Tax=Brassica cretica TaxID=69181 RepID=A0ABQ7EW43_BRACR|nr:hypothetical protein DY000_02046396 [Brassica cretica]
MPKLDEWTEKLEVARYMRSGRGGKYLACTRWNGQARDVAMHSTEACGLTCGRRGVSLHGARPCIYTGRGRGVTFHPTTLSHFNTSRTLQILENSYSADFESAPGEGSVQQKISRVKISSEVGLLEKFGKGFGSQKSGSRYLEVGSWQEAGSN